MIDNVTVVIRCAGERTANLCYQLAAAQVPERNIVSIHAKPFYKAVEKTFQVGIKSAKPWTLALDADVLIRQDAIEIMLHNAHKLGDNLYIYQGYVFDYLFRDFREGGPHLYQTKHLNKAIEYFSYDRKQLRPESATYHKMSEAGFVFRVDNRVYGIHDFFQYRKDIIRKTYTHSIKHRWLVPKLIDNYMNGIHEDSDMKAAAIGLFSGLMETDRVQVDIDYFEPLALQLMTRYALLEKYEIEDDTEFEPGIVENILSQFLSGTYQTSKRFTHLRVRQLPTDQHLKSRIINFLRLHVYTRSVSRLSRLLIRIGERVKRLA